MYTKLIISLNGHEVVFQAHEIVLIAQNVINNYVFPTNIATQVSVPEPQFYRENIATRVTTLSLSEIAEGAVDDAITLPLYLENLNTTGRWLYTTNKLRERYETSEDLIRGSWVKIGDRLILVKNTAEWKYYVSDHGYISEVTENIRHLAFGFDWTNPYVMLPVVTVVKKLEKMAPWKRQKFKEEYIQSIKDENIEVLRDFHPDKSDFQLYEIVRGITQDPVSFFLSLDEDNRYVVEVLLKKYMQLKSLEMRNFDHDVFYALYVFDFRKGAELKDDNDIYVLTKNWHQRRQEAYDLIKRIVLRKITEDVNLGVHDSLFRPVTSYGDKDKGSAYSDFARTASEYFAQDEHFSEAQIAQIMRSLLKGESINLGTAYFVPNLVSAWFISETTRNPLSLFSGLMLMDFLEHGDVYDDHGNLYNLHNMLVHPLITTESLYDKTLRESIRDSKILDLYGEEVKVQRFDSFHPMSHEGAVKDCRPIKDNTKLTAVRQKEASLYFHWLKLCLEKMGVECRLVKADEEMLKKSDVNLSRVNHGYVESDRMTQLKTKIEKVQGTIRAKNKKGESAEKQLKELQLYQLEQESLLLKHFVEMKYIIPLLQERLSSFDNLLSRTSSNDNGYAVRELSKYEWDEFAGAMKLTSVKGSQYTRDAVDIFPIRADGNCMYNAIRNGLSRLPEAYTGNREVTLNDLRAEVADEIEGNFQFYVEDLEAQLLANIIEGDVVGFNTQVGNIIFTLNNLYLTL
jgi:hypothetical protein